jgi:hypothetical protein
MFETPWWRFFVLNFLLWSFDFVSDFEFRISNFASVRAAGVLLPPAPHF